MNDLGLIATGIPKEHFPSLRFLGRASKADLSCDRAGVHSHQFFWARNAIYHSLLALGISRGAHVLLPAYLCRAAVEPFEAFGAQIEFYGVGRDCYPDFSEIESRITTRTEAILAVHYFGFPQKIDEFRSLCDRRRLALIEDCAHVLHNPGHNEYLGTFGDASVFSWRKFLPVYDGGELWLRQRSVSWNVSWSRETPLFTLKVAKYLFDRSLENSSSAVAKRISAVVESLTAFAKRLKNAGSVSTGTPLFALDSEEPEFDPSLLNQPMSRLSRWLKKHSNITAIATRRRQNFQFLRDHLQSIPGVTLLRAELPEEGCPWVLPVFFDGVVNAHLRLQEQGVPAVNWAGVRPKALQRGMFPEVDFLYENLIFLPIHQNLTRGALETIVGAVQKTQADSTALTAMTRLIGSTVTQ